MTFRSLIKTSTVANDGGPDLYVTTSPAIGARAMAKVRKPNKTPSLRSYTYFQYHEYLQMNDMIRLRWKYLFDGRPQYNTNLFRNFVIGMWKVESMSLADACLLLPELKSTNTQREYIYKLYDSNILNSVVYVGSDKNKRDEEKSYGRGKASPLVWLSDEARAKVDLYLDDAVDQLVNTATKITTSLRYA